MASEVVQGTVYVLDDSGNEYAYEGATHWTVDHGFLTVHNLGKDLAAFAPGFWRGVFKTQDNAVSRAV